MYEKSFVHGQTSDRDAILLPSFGETSRPNESAVSQQTPKTTILYEGH